MLAMLVTVRVALISQCVVVLAMPQAKSAMTEPPAKASLDDALTASQPEMSLATEGRDLDFTPSTIPARPTTTTLDRHSMPPFKASGAWTSAQCYSQDNAHLPQATAWANADGNAALDQIVAAFEDRDLSQPPGSIPSNFSSFLWDIFHYDTHGDCGNLDIVACENREVCGGGSAAPPAVHLIMNSISYVHEISRVTLARLQRVKDIISDQMRRLVDTFAPKKDDKTDIIVKEVLDAISFTIGIGSAFSWNSSIKKWAVFAGEGNERHGRAKDIFNAAVTFSINAAKDSIKLNPEQPNDIVEFLRGKIADYFSEYHQSLQTWLTQTIAFQFGNDSTPMKLLLKDGAMLATQQLGMGELGDQELSQKQFIYGVAIPGAWSASSKNYHPFILRVGKEVAHCPESLPKSGSFQSGKRFQQVGDYMDDTTMIKSRICDPEGNSWFLLGGVQTKENCSPLTGCINDFRDYPFQTMDGMSQLYTPDNIWANLTIKDMILSSYGGFVLNGNRNDYKPDPDSIKMVKDDFSVVDVDGIQTAFAGGVRTPGFFNFNICLDYKEAFKTLYAIKADDRKTPLCGTVPQAVNTSSTVGGPSAYAAGWCGVHVTQYQKNEGDQNRAGEYQTTITVKDASGNTVGEASKQPNGPERPVIVVDSSLPYQMIVAPGKVDDEGVQFWYADQWWTSTDSQGHQCAVGSYDNGNRDLDCGFTCDIPTGDPPVMATIAHPLPGKPTAGIGGPDAFMNTWTVAPPIETAPPEEKGGYKHGWCTFHLTQHQRNQPDNKGDKFGVEVTVYEPGSETRLAVLGQTQVAPNDKVSVQGRLQWTLDIHMGAGDDDPVTFNYGADAWDSRTSSEDSRCRTGGFDGGKREMDCGFTC